MNMAPYPLEGRAADVLSRAGSLEAWQPTGLTRDLYIRLADPIARQALPWQREDGRIIDPYIGKEVFSATPRFVGALAPLIRAGVGLDLVEACARSMDTACEDLFFASERPNVVAGEFYVKELMAGYLALRDKVDRERVRRWEHFLGGYDPEKNYAAVASKRDELHNFCTFALAGEAFKRRYGLADNSAFIDRYIETQKKLFTAFGMYRDPNDPMTYDIVPKMNLSLMMFFGYDGPHRGFVDEMLRRGALTMLLYLSSCAEVPFGGRSNQQHFNEAMTALVCEYEARRYKALGDTQLAGAFKRTARLAAAAVKRWIDLRPVRFSKNCFPPETQHAREAGYGWYSPYSLLIASLFGFAHLLADDTIEETPAPFEVGGYVVHFPQAFHKVFATCQRYHVEIDTKADHHYDATGLGRLHRSPAPTELALSVPIVPAPSYILCCEPSPRAAAIGPGWEDAAGSICWLAELSEEIQDVDVRVIREDIGTVEFAVRYRGDMRGCEAVEERCMIDASGVTVTETVVGSRSPSILMQVPLLETDGMHRSRIERTRDGFVVSYEGYRYRVMCLHPEAVEVALKPFAAPNRNGIYRIGCCRAPGNTISCRMEIASTGPGEGGSSQPKCSLTT